MHKIFFVFLLLSSSITASRQYYNNDPILCLDANFAQLYQTSWHMLEDIFITQPQITAGSWLGKRGLSLSTGLLTGCCSFLLSKKGIEYLNTPAITYPHLDRYKNLLTSGTGLASALGAYTLSHAYLIHLEERKQLERILDSWPCVKEFFPKQLHACLDNLALLYHKKEPLYNQNADEALRLIKNAIYEHFPRKYSKKSWTDFFSERSFNIYLNVDVLRVAEKMYQFVRNRIL